MYNYDNFIKCILYVMKSLFTPFIISVTYRCSGVKVSVICISFCDGKLFNRCNVSFSALSDVNLDSVTVVHPTYCEGNIMDVMKNFYNYINE